MDGHELVAGDAGALRTSSTATPTPASFACATARRMPAPASRTSIEVSVFGGTTALDLRHD